MVLRVAATAVAGLLGAFQPRSPSPGAQVAIASQDSTCLAQGIARAQRLIATHRDLLDIPGMQVAAARDGKLLWSQSWGYADLEHRTPVSRLTSFRIASLSKSLTSAGMMLLAQEGRLDLDAPIQRYVPSFPVKRWVVTARQLAGNIAGVRHYRDAEEASNLRHFATVTDALSPFRNDSLLFEPGTRIEYSSPSYVLLSAAIEAASGRSYLDFMRERLFQPLGMDGTGADHPDSIVPHRSRSYVEDPAGNRANAPFIDPSSKWASGGLVSTSEDLVRFGMALLKGSPLTPASVERLFTPMTLRDGRSTGYGMGWDIRRDGAGRRVIAHDGSLPSARALLVLYPDQRLVLALLMNTGQSVFLNQTEAMYLAEQFLDIPCTTLPGRGSATDLAGTYAYDIDRFDGAPVSGTIQLYRSSGAYRGTITVPNSFYGHRPMPIPSITLHSDRLEMVGILNGNWIRLSLSRAEPVTGSWVFGSESGLLKNVRRLR